MMFKQNGSNCRTVVLLIYISLLIAVCSSISIHERVRPSADMSNCNVARGYYETFCYGQPTGDREREDDVKKCFDKLYDGREWKLGCINRQHGSCRCTVDSSFIWDWRGRFREARASLYQQCGGFTNSIMKRYEGNIYLTATCD